MTRCDGTTEVSHVPCVWKISRARGRAGYEDVFGELAECDWRVEQASRRDQDKLTLSACLTGGNMRYLSPVARLCIATGLLSACAPVPISSDSTSASVSANPVLCIGKAQCEIYWQRAQAWVANNSAYRLQTVTDAVIETERPAWARSDLAFRVTRVPDDKDGARIFVLAACGNAFGCNPPSSDAVTAFKQFVTN